MECAEVAGKATFMAAGRRPGEECDAAAAFVEQVPRASEAAIQVVGCDEIIFERAVDSAEVALDQDDHKPDLAARAEERFVLASRLICMARGHEDHSRHALLGGPPSLAPEVGRARRLVEMKPIERDLDPFAAADGRETCLRKGLARVQPRPWGAPLHERKTLSARCRRGWRHEAARPLDRPDQPLVSQHLNRSRRRNDRDAVRRGDLSRAGDLRAVAARNLRLDGPSDIKVFWQRGRRHPTTSRGEGKPSLPSSTCARRLLRPHSPECQPGSRIRQRFHRSRTSRPAKLYSTVSYVEAEKCSSSRRSEPALLENHGQSFIDNSFAHGRNRRNNRRVFAVRLYIQRDTPVGLFPAQGFRPMRRSHNDAFAGCGQCGADFRARDGVVWRHGRRALRR